MNWSVKSILSVRMAHGCNLQHQWVDNVQKNKKMLFNGDSLNDCTPENEQRDLKC